MIYKCIIFKYNNRLIFYFNSYLLVMLFCVTFNMIILKYCKVNFINNEMWKLF